MWREALCITALLCLSLPIRAESPSEISSDASLDASDDALIAPLPDASTDLPADVSADKTPAERERYNKMPTFHHGEPRRPDFYSPSLPSMLDPTSLRPSAAPERAEAKEQNSAQAIRVLQEKILQTLEVTQVGVKSSVDWTKDQIKELGNSKEVAKLSKAVEATTQQVIRKRAYQIGGHPLTLQGLPILYPLGGHTYYGIRAQLYDLKVEKPYYFGLALQLVENEERARSHLMTFDLPDFLGWFRLRLRTGWSQNPTTRYFEAGNNSTNVPGRDEDYFFGVRTFSQGATLSVKVLEKQHHVYFGALVQDVHISDLGKLIALRLPYGVEGKQSNLMMLGYNYDTRDNEFMTKSGTFSSIAAAWHTLLVGSDYEFRRYNLVSMRFWELIPAGRVVMANKSAVDWIVGNAPFFERNLFFGYSQYAGLGGAQTLRGFVSGRFSDDAKFSNQFELRFYSGESFIKNHQFRYYFIPFFDMGRVWSKRPFETLAGLHTSGGIGGRVVWNERFIIRLDTAYSSEGLVTHGGFGSTF